MLKTRVLSAAVGIPIIILLVYIGGMAFDLAVLAISLIGLYEFSRAMGKKSNDLFYILSCLVSLIILLTANKANFNDYVAFIGVFYVICSGFIVVLFSDKYSFRDAALSIFGVLYIPFMLSHLTAIRTMTCGFSVIWLCFLSTWATDTFAYFTGRAIGKNKLCPSVSPNKTVEGAIGGLVGSIVISIAWAYISKKFFIVPNNFYMKYVIVGVGAGVLSQFGDLTASIIKRKVKIKDYGDLIPGHGGILDRFDSMIFVAPFIYYVFSLIK